MIIIIRNRATPEQIEQMLEEQKFYIKLAVDIERRILAGGGEMHYFCEQALLEDGSSQKNIWGAGFMPRENAPYFLTKINKDFKVICISAKLDKKINKINRFFCRRIN